MQKKSPTLALIVAAGSSSRMGGELPKPYMKVGGKAILAHTVEAFLSHPGIDGVRVIMRREDHARCKQACSPYTMFPAAVGGNTRQESVRRGLLALKHVNPARILVHDAARPCISHDVIDRVLAALDHHEAVIPTLPVADTLKKITDEMVETTISRESLYMVQTPQGFHYAPFLALHERYAGENFTDDAALYEAAGKKVATVAGETSNFKITTPSDMTRFMQQLTQTYETRTGMGFDVHALRAHSPDTLPPAQTIKLCGIQIPHTHYLEGHSDADVGLHAVVDALLGAMAEGDIGMHFPPDDQRWKGADSERFLLHAFEMLVARGGVISHLDITLICERPKISQYRDAMREHIASLLKLDIKRVSVKATTTEKLGFTGRSEGIAAQAVATITLPEAG